MMTPNPNDYRRSDVEKLARVIDPAVWAAHDRSPDPAGTSCRALAPSITAAVRALLAGYRDCRMDPTQL